MKRMFFFTISFLLLFGHMTFSKSKFVLESSMLKALDGSGIGGKSFGLMLQNRREIRKRVYGVQDETGNRVGMYEFEGDPYCLLELAQIEHEIENSPHDQDCEERMVRLQEVLEIAKEDFLNFTIGYIESIGGVKGLLMPLLEEFCEKRGLERCLLLRWGQVDSGDEGEVIRNEVLTCKDFTGFCIDLADFLEVLARSCPRGKALFVEMVKKSKRNK
ncbi:hypothetical protein ACFLYA_01740 [Candidatus Dependentiae bacterium]